VDFLITNLSLSSQLNITENQNMEGMEQSENTWVKGCIFVAAVQKNLIFLNSLCFTLKNHIKAISLTAQFLALTNQTYSAGSISRRISHSLYSYPNVLVEINWDVAAEKNIHVLHHYTIILKLFIIVFNQEEPSYLTIRSEKDR
jgi:hypothetical protein